VQHRGHRGARMISVEDLGPTWTLALNVAFLGVFLWLWPLARDAATLDPALLCALRSYISSRGCWNAPGPPERPAESNLRPAAKGGPPESA